MLKQFKAFLLRKFREHYENRIGIDYGVRQFIANVAFIQLTHEEEVHLNTPSGWMGDIILTTVGMRPHLTYKVWLPETEYDEDMMIVQVLIEAVNKFQIHRVDSIGQELTEWEPVDFSDARLSPLKDLFLGFAFYAPLRAEMKKKKA